MFPANNVFLYSPAPTFRTGIKKNSFEESTIKTIIYYFTGTGNSLAAAKSICTHLGDCELVSIASLAGTSGEIQPGADRVGIVCPVYDFGLPSIVAEFVQKPL